MLRVMKGKGKTATTVIETDEYLVLVSYETPVAYELKETGACYRTSTKYSATTSRHINQFLDGRTATEVSQETVSNILEALS